MVPGVPCVDGGNWVSECDSSCLYHVLALRKQHNLQNAGFGKTVLQRFMSSTLTPFVAGSHEMMSSVFGMGHQSTNSVA